jgi:hypothetical protein
MMAIRSFSTADTRALLRTLATKLSRALALEKQMPLHFRRSKGKSIVNLHQTPSLVKVKKDIKDGGEDTWKLALHFV